MSSGRSFKVEFKTREQASKFINSTNTSIGGIILKPEHKEMEVDPTVRQCWVCGRIANHGSNECSDTQRCLKCGDRGHKFFECRIPRKQEDMSDKEKQR